MSQSFNEELARVPMSPNLVATLTRAADYAREQGHGRVTLEHMLLALTQDTDAPLVLQASGVAIDGLTSDIATHLATLEPAIADGGQAQLSLGQDLKRVLEAAAAAAQQGRRQVSGAIVLAAIVGEGKSTAAQILRAHGLTFEHAIKALQQAGRGQGARGAAPAQRRPEPKPAQSTPQAVAPHPPATAEGGARASDPGPAPTAPTPRPQAAPAVAAEPPPAPVPPPTAAPPPPVPVSAPPRTEEPTPVTAPPPLRARPQQPPQPPPTPAAPQPEVASAPAPRDQSAGARAPQGQPGAPSAPAPARSFEPDWAPSGLANGAFPVPEPRSPAQRQAPPTRELPNLPAPPPPNEKPEWPPQPRTAPPAYQPQAPSPPPAPFSPPARFEPEPHLPREQPPHWPARTAPQPPDTAGGQLIENIPRTMRSAVPLVVEVRLVPSNDGPPPGYEHAVLPTRAMTVRLIAPDDGFQIDTIAAETQWIDGAPPASGQPMARWRWKVTPQHGGRLKLQLAVSARWIGPEGISADVPLPVQVVTIDVRRAYGRGFARLLGWLFAAAVGAGLASFGGPLWMIARAALKPWIGG